MKTFEVKTAYDQRVLRTYSFTPRDEAFAALSQAHGLYEDRTGWIPPQTRIQVLTRLQELVRARRESLARDAALEGGKPWGDTLVEIDRGVDGIGIAIRELQTMHGTEIPMGITASSERRWATTFREPRGVVLSISAFNHPFNLIIHQVIPAIAVGCPVLIKPAMTTPISCENLVDLIGEAGYPEGWCRMLLTEDEVTSELVADERVSFMSFIGSARVGWMLRAKLAPGATCALEHGGVAPAIVDETADLDSAIPLLLKGGFYHAGQVCVSVQRIYVNNAIIDEFTRRFVEGAKALKVGDPTDASTEVGPLILPREVERVHDWITQAREAGAKILCGGEPLSDTTYPATVLLEPPEDAKVSTEEIFGPAVCIYGYDDIDDAIERANGPHTFFQASVFTRDLDVAIDCTRRLRGMAVMVNDHTAFRVDWMPFGGHLSSGLGVGGIGYSMRDMTLTRLAVFRSDVL